MLSVLIPTYNCKCYTLVSELQRQLELAGVEYEVIVAEDGGKDQVVAISNLRINELPHCRFIRRSYNVGRSAIRNFLADEAKGEWLLIMDSDGLVVREDFIKKYLDATNEGGDVVCGGIMHPDRCPSQEQSLRWKYEKDYERRHGFVSEQFRSFCFMIRRDVFLQIRFDEHYNIYGWEDVQFGMDLENHGYHIRSINNPLLNSDIETNSQFLEKTEEAMRSLKQHSEYLRNRIYLLRVSDKLTAMHLSGLASVFYSISRPWLRKNLLSTNPNLNAFALYKLGYYLSLK